MACGGETSWASGSAWAAGGWGRSLTSLRDWEQSEDEILLGRVERMRSIGEEVNKHNNGERDARENN